MSEAVEAAAMPVASTEYSGSRHQGQRSSGDSWPQHPPHKAPSAACPHPLKFTRHWVDEPGGIADDDHVVVVGGFEACLLTWERMQTPFVLGLMMVGGAHTARQQTQNTHTNNWTDTTHRRPPPPLPHRPHHAHPPWPPTRSEPARMRSHLGLGPMAREMKGSCLIAFSCSRLRSSACSAAAAWRHRHTVGRVGWGQWAWVEGGCGQGCQGRRAGFMQFKLLQLMKLLHQLPEATVRASLPASAAVLCCTMPPRPLPTPAPPHAPLTVTLPICPFARAAPQGMR